MKSLAFAPLLAAAILGCSSDNPPGVRFKPRPGSLELVIVANDVDDKEAIDAAQAGFRNANSNL